MTQRSCVVLLSLYTKHRHGAGQCIAMCLCLSASTNTNIHTHKHINTHKTPLRSDPPIASPSFKKKKNQTHTSLFQLPFFPPSSPHQIYLNSPTVSFFPFSLSLISNVSMCCHHKHTHTQGRSVKHHNLVIIISTLKPQFMTDDLLNRLQLIAPISNYF